MTFDPRAAMRKSIRHLKPYYRAPDEPLLRLDQNTNLYGRNPALGKVPVPGLDFNQYPSRDADRLLRALETRHSLPPGTVLAGNGSDEVLDLVFKAFTDPGDVLVTPDPSYSLYPFYAALHALKHAQVPLDADFDVDVDALLAPRPKVLLVASPNNPTGRAVSPAKLDRLVKEAPGLVVIDEAYTEFSGHATLLPRIREHRNLVVMRTFSKAYGIAGARLGWVAAHPDTAAILGLVKPPFNVNVFSEDLGIRALSEEAFVHGSIDMVKRERPRLAGALAQLGFRVVPSDANFLLTFPPENGPDGPLLCHTLRNQGIATRTFTHIPRLANSIRFTVGRAEDNDRLLVTLPRLLKEVSP